MGWVGLHKPCVSPCYGADESQHPPILKPSMHTSQVWLNIAAQCRSAVCRSTLSLVPVPWGYALLDKHNTDEGCVEENNGGGWVGA